MTRWCVYIGMLWRRGICYNGVIMEWYLLFAWVWVACAVCSCSFAFVISWIKHAFRHSILWLYWGALRSRSWYMYLVQSGGVAYRPGPDWVMKVIGWWHGIDYDKLERVVRAAQVLR